MPCDARIAEGNGEGNAINHTSRFFLGGDKKNEKKIWKIT